ncbi:MAG: hypothetical protein PVG99_12575 [Desulfobacteraceae bacterium]|jgi:hypothetical protein
MFSMSHAYTLESLQKALPEQVMDWAKAEEDRFYDDQTIFEYIDGAGEVYRAYHMNRCLSRRYTMQNGPALILDIFDMGSSGDAFGVFTHDPDGEPLDLGQGALYRAGWLRFWKDRFFVSVYAEQETEATEKALRELGRSVASAIKQEGRKPIILSYLPPEGLQPMSVRFFHDSNVMSMHYYLSDENILDLNLHTDAVLAAYQQSQGFAQVLLVLYPDTEKAAGAHASFLTHYLPDADSRGFALLENKKWSAAGLKKELIAVILEADSRELAESLLKETMDRY